MICIKLIQAIRSVVFVEVVAKLARKEGILPEMKEWICDVLIHS